MITPPFVMFRLRDEVRGADGSRRVPAGTPFPPPRPPLRAGGATRAAIRRGRMTHRQERPNRPAPSLPLPAPSARPGDEIDFSSIDIPAAGAVRRPDPHAPASETHE